MTTHDERAKFSEQLKSRVDKLNQKIDELEVKSELAKKDLQDDVQRRYDELKAKRDELTAKLEELRTVGDAHLAQLRARADELWETAGTAFEDLKQRLLG